MPGTSRSASPSTICSTRLGIELLLADNVFPDVDVLNIEPLRHLIHEVFSRHIIHAPGMARFAELTHWGILPTPGAVLRGAELFAEVMGDCLIFDVGGATTDVHSVTDGSTEFASKLVEPEPRAKRTVEGDLGVYVNARNIMDMAGDAAWEARMADLQAMPQTEREKELTRWLCARAVETGAKRHAGVISDLYTPTGKKQIVKGKDLTGVKWVVATGGALTRVEGGADCLRAICTGAGKYLLPSKDARILIDRNYLFSALGTLAQAYPEEVKQTFARWAGEEGDLALAAAGRGPQPELSHDPGALPMYYRTPRLEIYPERITANARSVIQACHDHGGTVACVTKVTCAHPAVVHAFELGGADMIADSRITNLMSMSNTGLSVPLMLLRIPAPSRAADVVRCADVTLNSSLQTIQLLSEAAQFLRKRHQVIVMVDVGDLREGVWPDRAIEVVKGAAQLPNIDVIGLGCNLACYGGVIPSVENMNALIEIRNACRKATGLELATLSGGNSSSLPAAGLRADAEGDQPLPVGRIHRAGAQRPGPLSLARDPPGHLPDGGRGGRGGAQALHSHRGPGPERLRRDLRVRGPRRPAPGHPATWAARTSSWTASSPRSKASPCWAAPAIT